MGLVRPGAGGPWWRRCADAVALARGRVLTSVVAVVVVAGASWWLLRSPSPPVESSLPVARPGGTTAATAGPTSTALLVVVQAAGAVVRPGLYQLPAGSRVADLVTAAGAAPDASLESLALASRLVDGQRVWVPRRGEAPPASVPGPTAAPEPLDLNSATVDQLDALPGVGPATAQRIVAHRERSGPYRRVDDLLDVPGIGPATLEALRPLVRVGS